MKWRYLLSSDKNADHDTQMLARVLDAYERVSVLVQDPAVRRTLMQQAESAISDWMPVRGAPVLTARLTSATSPCAGTHHPAKGSLT